MSRVSFGTVWAFAFTSFASAFAVVSMGGCSSEEYHHGYGRDDLPPPPLCSTVASCGACTPIVGCGWCDFGDGTGACATGPSACKAPTFRWNWEPNACPASGYDAGPNDTSSNADASSDVMSEASSEASSDVASDATSSDAGTDVVTEIDTGREIPDGRRDDGAIEASADAGSDASSETSVSDATSTDATETLACAPPSDIGSPGCVVTTGGSACTGDTFTVGCHGDPAAVPTPNGALKCEATSAGASPGSKYYCCPCSH